jgi:hypothetical protein
MGFWGLDEPEPPPKVCANGHTVDRRTTRCPECGTNSFKIDRHALRGLSPAVRSDIIRTCHSEGDSFVLEGPPGGGTDRGAIARPPEVAARNRRILELANVPEPPPWATIVRIIAEEGYPGIGEDQVRKIAKMEASLRGIKLPRRKRGPKREAE